MNIDKENQEFTKLVDLLQRIELAGDEILLDKSELIQLDKKRQANREANRTLSKLSDKKVYLNFGKTFVRLPTNKAKKLIESDQVAISDEVERLRNGLKAKLDKLYELENRQDDLANVAAFKLPAINNVSSG